MIVDHDPGDECHVAVDGGPNAEINAVATCHNGPTLVHAILARDKLLRKLTKAHHEAANLHFSDA